MTFHAIFELSMEFMREQFGRNGLAVLQKQKNFFEKEKFFRIVLYTLKIFLELSGGL